MPNFDIRLMDKKHNSTGLQLADLVAHPIGRHAISRTLEHAQEMAAHGSPRTTKLYDRTKERLTQDEVERIRL